MSECLRGILIPKSPGWADRSGLGAERGAALCCAYTALPTPTLYRRAGEVGNAVPLPYYQLPNVPALGRAGP